MSNFEPPPDGFRDALRRSLARRRRRHLFEAAAGGTALVAAAVLLLSVNPGGLVSLRQDQPAGRGTTPQGSPRTSGSPRPGLPSSGLVSTSSAPAAGSNAGGTSSKPTPTQLDPSTGPSAPGVLLISTAPSRQATDYSNLSPCADTSGSEASGWCVQPGSSFVGHSGHANDLSVSLCRLPGVLDGQASFPSTLESSFALKTTDAASTTVWSLDAQHPGQPSRHTVPVAAGQCLTWSVTWYARDNAGHDLPAGQYTLTDTINADNVSAPNQALVENFAYTVTN